MRLYLWQVMFELQKEGKFEHYLTKSQQLLAADCLDAQLEHDCLSKWKNEYKANGNMAIPSHNVLKLKSHIIKGDFGQF
jgi:hypothetical protein